MSPSQINSDDTPDIIFNILIFVLMSSRSDDSLIQNIYIVDDFHFQEVSLTFPGGNKPSATYISIYTGAFWHIMDVI